MKHSTAVKYVEREQRLAKIAETYINNPDHPEITQEVLAAEFNVSRSMISKDVTLLKKRWADKAHAEISEHVALELAKLDSREAEARKWLNHFGIKENGEIREERYNSKEAVKWMDTLLKIAEQRAKFLGLFKPEKFEVEEKGKVIIYLPEKEPIDD